MLPELIWEDNLLEFKSESDTQDFLKTIVAFANSVKSGHIAIFKIGVDNDGVVKGVKNPDEIQKKVRKECDKIFPSVLWKSFIKEDNGKQYV
jgi:predicted HTH transcriptional regulator